MLIFELSKMIDSIYKYGKCILQVKVDSKTFKELEIKVDNENFNIDDDLLLQILSILYSEAFTPKKYDSYRSFFIKMEQQENNELLAINDILPFVVNEKSEITTSIKDLSGLCLLNCENTYLATLKLCGMISKMLSCCNPLTDSLDISAHKIYESVKNNSYEKSYVLTNLDNVANDYFDKRLIPASIIEVLKLRKNIMKSKNLGDETIRIIDMISEISCLLENEGFDNIKIAEILKRHDYNGIPDERKNILNNYLKDIGYDKNGEYHI